MRVAKLIGGPGTGKTRELLAILVRALEKSGASPYDVGFVSFTRMARREASTRAGEIFGIPPQDLEQQGWFRTLHSCCYQLLGIQKGELLIPTEAESKEWTAEIFGQPVELPQYEGDVIEPMRLSRERISQALALWAIARARFLAFSYVWKVTYQRGLSWEERVLRKIVEKYEAAKARDGRLDFTDLMLRYIGAVHKIEYAERVRPMGLIPSVSIWFYDEAQDASRLNMLVFERLTTNARWVYLGGDPFQSIYEFAGSDPRQFLGFPCHERRIMPHSWRCPAPILARGESVICGTEGYFDRKITPAEHDGKVYDQQRHDGSLLQINPHEQWLVLARANFQADELGDLLTKQRIPWTSLRREQRCPAQLRRVKTLLDLRSGATIDGDHWADLLEIVKSKQFLMRGTKKRFENERERMTAKVALNGIALYGGTEALVNVITNRAEWPALDGGAQLYQLARTIEKWGMELVERPRVRVGTIHAAKGAEADNVFLLKSITPRIEDALDGTGYDAECRTWYTGITRARRKLMLIEESGRPAMPI